MVNARKVEWVEKITEEIEQSPNIIFTSFRGLTVEKMEKLRRQLYECDTTYHVVKNRLARRAFSNFTGNGETSAGEEVGTETVPDSPEVDAELTDLPGVGPSKAEDLKEAGFDSVADVISASEEDLQEVSGIGSARAEKILAAAGEFSAAPVEPELEVDAELTDLPGVGPSKAEDLKEAGFDSVADVISASEEDLQEVSGIGSARAEKILAAAGELADEVTGKKTEEPEAGEEPGGRDLPDVQPFLSGNTAIAFNRGGVVKAAKVLVEFSEEIEPLKIKGGILEKKLLQKEEIERLSELPSRRELLTQVAMSLNSPLQNLVRYLRDPVQKLVQVINRVKDNKEDSKE